MTFEFGRWSMWPRIRLILAFGLLAVLTACGGGGGGVDGNSTSAAANSPQLAPAGDLLMSSQTACSYEHVYITVQALRLRQAGAAGQRWREVSLATPRRIDLLNLQGGLLQSLGLPPLTPGRYTEIRLVVSDSASDSASDVPANAVQPAGGTLMPLQVPSGSSSGVKLDGDFDVPPLRSADVALQGFDPCQAIVRAGNSGRYQLRPQLNARLALLTTSQELRLNGDEVIAVPGGGFAVVRRTSDALFVQRYSAQGELAGSEVRIGLEDILVGYPPVEVTALAPGGYVLNWLGPPLTESTFPPYPVMVRFYDASGNSVSAAEQVGATQTFKSPVVQWAPPVSAALTGGGYVIAWAESQSTLRSQPFDAAGQPIGTSRLSGLGGLNFHVLGLASGGYMLVSGLNSIAARSYTADGTELGPPRIVVAQTGWTPFSSIDIALAALASGGAAVSWTTETAGQPDLSFVQLLAADATPVGDPLQVSARVSAPLVAGLADGSFLVMSSGQITPFGPNAVPLGPPVPVRITGSSPQGMQFLPIGGSAFLLAWTAIGPNGERVLYVRLAPSLSTLSAESTTN